MLKLYALWLEYALSSCRSSHGTFPARWREGERGQKRERQRGGGDLPWALSDDVLITCPLRFIAGRSSFVSAKGAKTFTAKVSSYPSAEVCLCSSAKTPALLMSTSSPSTFSLTWSATPLTCARERERGGGRGKVWEWSRSGRREDEDANRAADPRGREGRVESGLPQQQQQQKKKEEGEGRGVGEPSVAHLYALRISESVASLVTPRTSYSSSSLMANPPSALSLSLSRSRRSRRAKFSLLFSSPISETRSRI